MQTDQEIVDKAEAILEHVGHNLTQDDQELFDRADDILEHVGIKGMKWGIRKRKERAPHTAGGKKNVNHKTFSDDELKRVVARMKLEQEYIKLTAKPPSKGQKFMMDMLDFGGKLAIRTAISTTSEIVKAGHKNKRDNPAIIAKALGEAVRDTAHDAKDKKKKESGPMHGPVPLTKKQRKSMKAYQAELARRSKL